MKYKTKYRTVQSYPAWKQIAFDDITLTRGEFKVTEKLLHAQVYKAEYNAGKGSWLRLYVGGSYKEYK